VLKFKFKPELSFRAKREILYYKALADSRFLGGNDITTQYHSGEKSISEWALKEDRFPIMRRQLTLQPISTRLQKSGFELQRG
jgi:hypothetical protein